MGRQSSNSEFLTRLGSQRRTGTGLLRRNKQAVFHRNGFFKAMPDPRDEFDYRAGRMRESGMEMDLPHVARMRGYGQPVCERQIGHL